MVKRAIVSLIAVTSLMVALTVVVAAAAAAEPDLSTPQAAIKSLQRAVAEQDSEAAAKTLYCGDDADRALAAAFADLLVAGKKLDEATRAKFGTTGPAAGSAAAAGDALARLDQAPVSIKGDTATLTPPAVPSRTVRLKRTAAGQWQLVVRDFANPGDADLAAQAEVLTKVAGAFNEVAGQIAAGKFAGPQDAQAAIQSKLAGTMIQASRAAAMKAEGATTRKGAATGATTAGAATRP